MKTKHIVQRIALVISLGVAASDVGSLVQSTTQGSVATDVASTTMMIPVRVQMSGSGGAALVPTTVGAVPLSSLARLRAGGLSTDVTEENGERAMLITANVSGGSLSAAIHSGCGAVSRNTRFCAASCSSQERQSGWAAAS